MPTRSRRLGDTWAEFFAERSTCPIFVTIQPNFDRGAPSCVRGVRTGSSDFPNADRVWDLVQTVFFRADGLYNSISNAAYLPPWARFQGIGVLEKHKGNVHYHLLLDCLDPDDQFLRSLFLLEMFDNVAKHRDDLRDERWQREAWELIVAQGGWAEDLLWTRTSSILTPLAPAGTAMVQLVRTDEDRDTVCRYITKTWNDSTGTLADRKTVRCYDPTHDWKELSEFHSEMGHHRPARCSRIDPATGTVTLNLDKPLLWKQEGRVVR